MKHISNTDPFPSPYNLTIGNILNVPTINTTNLSTSNLFINGHKLDVSEGSWVPQIQCLRMSTALLKENWKDQYNMDGKGYYVKTGKIVNLWYEATAQFDGFQNDFLYSARFPILTNLPFKCLVAGTSIDLNFVGGISKAEFPNGYAGGFPVPLAVTMDGNYIPILNEEGFIFTPDIPPLYPTPSHSWTCDGYTIVFKCQQSQYAPLTADWSKEGTPYNFNVLATSTGYTAYFKGVISYFTDE